ncbi:ras association domain-containing protein 2-like isoform X1 [Paramormyrops kingsleyae]|nr:ras association domain-containing protein 2-like isoform X2 [Paramormyrops kingsleyae]
MEDRLQHTPPSRRLSPWSSRDKQIYGGLRGGAGEGEVPGADLRRLNPPRDKSHPCSSSSVRMGDEQEDVQIGENKYISKSTLLSHLKTYNLYYEGQNLQLRHREEEGELIVEGLLNIYWGLRRPIRLQMQDDNERIRPPPSSTSWHSGCNLDAQSKDGSKQAPPTIEVTSCDDQLNSPTMKEENAGEDDDSSSQLLRTKSDAGVFRRGNRRSPSDQRKIRRNRFSINGHYYNHKTAVFTPAYGSVTNVRINSCMKTPQVLRVLLNKFKIENSPDDFALYLVHTSGERGKLKRSDHPLSVRVLEGPCEQVSRIFLMEQDLGEEVTYDVAQYIKFEMPVLQSFITKLKEEEDREVQKLRTRYSTLRCIIEKQLQCLPEGTTCI